MATGAGWRRGCLSAAVAATAIWSYVLLDRSPDWYPGLRCAVVVAAGAAVLRILAGARLARWGRVLDGAAGAAAIVCLPGWPDPPPTASRPRRPRTPARCPAPGRPWPAAFGGPGGGGRRAGGGPSVLVAGATPVGAGPAPRAGLAGCRSGLARGLAPRRAGTGAPGRAVPAGGTGRAHGDRHGYRWRTRTGTGAAAGWRGGAAVLAALGGSTEVSSALIRLLENGARLHVGRGHRRLQSAAPLQLATGGEPVMSVGGFNGTDPAPTLAQFQALVAEHKIHYSWAQCPQLRRRIGRASAITSWVTAHFKARTVGGETVYNLARPQRPDAPLAPQLRRAVKGREAQVPVGPGPPRAPLLCLAGLRRRGRPRASRLVPSGQHARWRHWAC